MAAGEATAEARIDYLDGLRGLAALGVAAFYHLAYYSAVYRAGWLPLDAAPLAGTLFGRAVYGEGWSLVDVFFVVSGIIFTEKYSGPLARRDLGFGAFMALRMSRLYPVHLLALGLVAGLAALPGVTPIFPDNGPGALLLGLAMIVPIGALNAPAWSLTVEMLMYVLFFDFARRRGRALLAVGLALAGFALLFLGPALDIGYLPFVGRGLLGFFAGVAFWMVWKAHAGGRMRPTLLIALAAAGIGLLAGGLPFPAIHFLALALVAILELVPRLRPVLENPAMRFLGGISLSLYLMQVPVQMLIRSGFDAVGAVPPIGSPLFLLANAAAIVAAGALTRHFVEDPARRALRRRGPRLTAAVASSASPS